MLKTVILILSLLIISSLYAQEKVLNIFNEQKFKGTLIKENRKIRIKTNDGLKLTGRFKIVDDETIYIKNREIKLNQIKKIKKHPLVMSVILDGFFYYLGTTFILGSLALYALSSGDASVLLLMIPSPLFLYAAVKSPNILRSYNTADQWQFEIINLSD